METILAGLSDAFTFAILFYVALGVFIGILVGAIPGLSAPIAIAIAVPLTFYMSPLAAISFLVGVNKGGTAGGAIAAILLNTPGSPDAAATCFDGYPLAQQGKPLKALKLALYSSVSGDSFSDMVLILVSAPLAVVALKMGPTEITAVVAFAMTIIAGLVGKSMIKGLIAAFLGIFLSTVGLDPEAATERLTFGVVELMDGIPLVAIGIGTLALGEIIRQLETRHTGPKKMIALDRNAPREDRRVSWAEYRSCLRTIFRSAVIGTLIGATPGIGSSVAAFLGYGAAKRASKTPEEFGTGKLEGIAATEAANSAVAGANLIPLLTLGIPGNVSAALIIGAFIIHGIEPGPLLFEQQGRLIYGLFGAMVIANMCNFVIGNVGLRLFVNVLRVPSTIIFPVVLVLCMAGAYIAGGGMFSLGMMLVFGILGYLMRKLEFSFIAFIIGFVLGPMFELSLRSSIIVSNGKLAFLLDHPIALGFIALSCLSIWRLGFTRRDDAITF